MSNTGKDKDKTKDTAADSAKNELIRKEPDAEEPAVSDVEKTAPETDEAPAAEKKEIAEPAFITKRPDPDQIKKASPVKWGLILPAIVIVLCLAMFVVASQAGWIQSFLTPESKRTLRETALETTTPEETPEETTTEEPTTETTTEETTTEFVPSYYVIYVNLAYNRVTVYIRGEKLNDGADPDDPLDDEYELSPYIAFTCSPGLDGATPTGVYYLEGRSAWCLMIHDVYTQYATRIVDDVMFHSIPYLSKDPGDLATYDYNILGQDASSACIRLNCRDAYWIFNYCAIGTEVDIFYDWSWAGPIDPEPTYRIPEDFGELSRWDPTDYYSAGNPWNNYNASLITDNIELPCYSSVDRLLEAFGPHDNYGNSLVPYFYTDGNYDLDSPGTYYPTAYIKVANQSFTFNVTITVTEEIADEYYNGGVYDSPYDDDDDDWDDDGDDWDDDGDDWDDDGDDWDDDGDDWDDDGDDYSDDDYSEDDDWDDDYSEDDYWEDDYSGDDYTEDSYYAADEYSDDDYSEDTYEEDDYYGDDYSEDDYYGDDYSGDDYSEDDYSEDDYSEDEYSDDEYSEDYDHSEDSEDEYY